MAARARSDNRKHAQLKVQVTATQKSRLQQNRKAGSYVSKARRHGRKGRERAREGLREGGPVELSWILILMALLDDFGMERGSALEKRVARVVSVRAELTRAVRVGSTFSSQLRCPSQLGAGPSELESGLVDSGWG